MCVCCVCGCETRNETIDKPRNGTLQWRVTDIKPFYIPLTYLWSLGIDCNSNWTITKHMHVFSNDILSWTEPNTHRVFISLSNCSPVGFVSNEKKEKKWFFNSPPSHRSYTIFSRTKSFRIVFFIFFCHLYYSWTGVNSHVRRCRLCHLCRWGENERKATKRNFQRRARTFVTDFRKWNSKNWLPMKW